MESRSKAAFECQRTTEIVATCCKKAAVQGVFEVVELKLWWGIRAQRLPTFQAAHGLAFIIDTLGYQTTGWRG